MSTNRFLPGRHERSGARQTHHQHVSSTDDGLRHVSTVSSSSAAENATIPKRRLSTFSTTQSVPTDSVATSSSNHPSSTPAPAPTPTPVQPQNPESSVRQNSLSFRKNVLRRGKTVLRRAVTSATSSFSIRSNSSLGQSAQSNVSSSKPSQPTTATSRVSTTSTIPTSQPSVAQSSFMSKVSPTSPLVSQNQSSAENHTGEQSSQTLSASQVQPFDRRTAPFPSRSVQPVSYCTQSSKLSSDSTQLQWQPSHNSDQTPHTDQSSFEIPPITIPNSYSAEPSPTHCTLSGHHLDSIAPSAPADSVPTHLDVSVVPSSPTTNQSTPATTTLTDQLNRNLPPLPNLHTAQQQQPEERQNLISSDSAKSGPSDSSPPRPARPFSTTNGPASGISPKPVQPPTSVKPRRFSVSDHPKRASSSSIVLLQNASDVSNSEMPKLPDKRPNVQPQHSLHRRHASTTIVPNSISSLSVVPKRNASVSQNQILQRRFSNSSRQQPHTMASSPPVQVTSPSDRASDKSSQFASQQPSARVTRISKTGFMERSVAAAVISAARHRAQLSKKTRPSSSSKPPHHRLHGGFTNPWPSALKDTSLRTRSGTGSRTFFHKVARDRRPPDEQLATMLLLALRPDFSAIADAVRKDKFALASTWIGHSTFYLHARNLTVLTDPVWNNRLGPLGPKRLIPPPCSIEDLPSPIDVVILSSACYDHYDKTAIQALQPKVGQWLVPLGLKALLVSLSIPKDVIVELDWWQEHDVHGSKFVCTPSQHYSIREDTLWCSWAVHAPHHRFFYCGGTGYRSINNDFEDSESFENRVRFGGQPCPVFSEIGKNLGPFDTAFLPIGGFKPRVLMSGVQGDAVDMLFVHRDIRARRSVAHRWGTFSSVDEGLLDAVRMLEFALQTGPVSEHEFSYLKHGRLHLT